MKINLNSSAGNAFVLMAIMRDAMRQMDLSDDDSDEIIAEMEEGSYADLLNVMDRVFPHTFEFVGDPRVAAGVPDWSRNLCGRAD